MTPTLVDHAAIDLGLVGIQLKRGVNLEAACRDLIAAVEVLRERNTMLLRKNGERAKWASDANDRAEALEAREATLVEALADLLLWHRNQTPGVNEPPREFIGDAYSVLAATPEKALERARAVEACVKMLRRIADYRIEGPDEAIGACLTLQAMAEEPLEKLDALSKE